jgi:hypothetical protein
VTTAGSDASGRRDLAKLRAEYLAFIEVQLQAYLDFRDALDAASDVFRVIRAQVERDGDVRDLGAFIDPKHLRARLTSGLDEFERTRRTGQRMLYRLLLAEGATLDDISRAWDIPPEVVARLVAERD